MSGRESSPSLTRCSCGAEWGGERTSHCGFGCHETFTTVSNLDKHQDSRTGKCLPPDTVGLVRAKRAYPAWCTPGPVEGRSFLPREV